MTDYYRNEISRIKSRLDDLERRIEKRQKPKLVSMCLSQGYLFLHDDFGNRYQLLASDVPGDLILPEIR